MYRSLGRDQKGDFAMSIEENKAVVRRFFEELLSTDNFAVADEILSPGFRFYFAGSPEPLDLERYKEFLVARRAAFPDRRFVVEDMIAEGDRGNDEGHRHDPPRRWQDGGGSGRSRPVRNDAAVGRDSVTVASRGLMHPANHGRETFAGSCCGS